MTKKSISAHEAALKYLGLKMYSRLDLKQRLLAKKYDPAEVEGVLNELAEIGLLNDELYAETYLNNLIAYRSFGYYGIRAKLMQKKIDRALVDRILKKRLDIETEQKIARRFLAKSAKAGRPRQALMRALAQKGFRTQVIVTVIQRI